jgi:hypothetical protein
MLGRRGVRLAARPVCTRGGNSVEIQIHLGGATRVLALQVESCSPTLIASIVDACWRPSGFRPGFWPQGQSNQPTPLSRPEPKGRRFAAMSGLMAKIRKWLGLGKKS